MSASLARNLGNLIALPSQGQALKNGIIVSSPELTQDKVERFIYLVMTRQEAGTDVIVITTNQKTFLMAVLLRFYQRFTNIFGKSDLQIYSNKLKIAY